MDFKLEFDKYYQIISIDSNKRAKLLENKSLLRQKIKNDFKNNDREVPKFFVQGSMEKNTSTGINPLNGNYDIDDGVYLQNIDSSKPIYEWESPEEVHQWIYDTVEGHTKSTENLSKCVRVNYANNEKHIDLPIYVRKDDDYYLAIKRKGWIKSNPKDIAEWFADRNTVYGEDFRKCVRFLKAWKDKRESENTALKLPGGFQLSILVSNHFPLSTENTEELFFKLVQNINQNLWQYPPLMNPKNSSQDTMEHYTLARIDTFKSEFGKLYSDAKEAYNETNCQKKYEKWKKVFGDRFPQPSDSECENKTKALGLGTPLVIKGDANIKNTSGRMA
ncbi:MAG: nucleotidyltransferase [Campylobacteraceae bacterium]|jgi:hypothetical protein|nr:nucleotidyltransferase [Campylobacteraceae bacterium]